MRAILLLFALVSCAPPSQPSASEAARPPLSELAQQITADLARLDVELAADGVAAASIGETADLGDGLTVRPIEVTEESRCPGDVVCATSGNLRLRADVSGTERDLTLGVPLQTPQGALLLAVAKPRPFFHWPENEVPRPPYRFGFRRA
ncbi:MAG: hypothetical protein ACREH4_06530 [Vitreimonas sp.]